MRRQGEKQEEAKETPGGIKHITGSLLLCSFARWRFLRAFRGFGALCGSLVARLLRLLRQFFLILVKVKLIQLPAPNLLTVKILRRILRHHFPPVGSLDVQLDTLNAAFV